MFAQEKTGAAHAGAPGKNPFFKDIDTAMDCRPRRKSIPLVSELVSGLGSGWWLDGSTDRQ